MFGKASKTEKLKIEETGNRKPSDLVPFWCLPDDNGVSYIRKRNVPIERIVPMYPLSKDRLVYDRLVKVLTLYHLTLGQPRQEELLDIINAAGVDNGFLDDLFLNLSPWDRNGKNKKEAARNSD